MIYSYVYIYIYIYIYSNFKMFVWEGGGLNFKSSHFDHLCRCFVDVLQYLISIVMLNLPRAKKQSGT